MQQRKNQPKKKTRGTAINSFKCYDGKYAGVADGEYAGVKMASGWCNRGRDPGLWGPPIDSQRKPAKRVLHQPSISPPSVSNDTPRCVAQYHPSDAPGGARQMSAMIHPVGGRR